MKASVVLAPAFIALAKAAAFTNTEVNPQPGEPFTLTWSGASGPVDIVLRFGDPKNLDTVETLVSGATGTSATITLDPDDLPSGNYAFMIVDSSGENYSASFPFVGNAEAPPSQSGSTGSTRPTATSGTPRTSATATASESETESASRTQSTSASRTSDADDDANTTTSVPGTGSAPALSSPFALILVTVAAMFYFN